MVAPSEFEQILKTVSTWPAEEREQLARRLFAELGHERRRPPHGLTMADLVGVARGAGSIPDDEEVKRIVEEERLKEYGP